MIELILIFIILMLIITILSLSYKYNEKCKLIENHNLSESRLSNRANDEMISYRRILQDLKTKLHEQEIIIGENRDIIIKYNKLIAKPKRR